MPLVSLPVADSILGYVGAAVTNSMRLLAKDTPLSIDRVQAARLYGGMLEVRGSAFRRCGLELALELLRVFRVAALRVGAWSPPQPTLPRCDFPIAATQFGYFSRCLESECLARGVSLGSDSEAMIKLADVLEEEELHGICTVQTADGWYAAVSLYLPIMAGETTGCRATRVVLRTLTALATIDLLLYRSGTSAACSGCGRTQTCSSTAARFLTRTFRLRYPTSCSSRPPPSRSTTARQARRPTCRTRQKRRRTAAGRYAQMYYDGRSDIDALAVSCVLRVCSRVVRAPTLGG